MNKRLGLIMIGAAFVRLINLGQERLWFDEAFTAWVARPGTDFLAAVIGDTHPPLWSLIQAVSARLFGQSEFAFRLPAALFSVASVYLVYLIVERITYTLNHRMSLTAAALTAVMPGSLYFAQDGRMYAALGLFVLVMVYGLLLSRSQWLWIGGAICAMYTHTSGVLYVFALLFMVIGNEIRANFSDECNRRVLRDYLKATFYRYGPPMLIIGFAYLPYVGILLSQMRSVGAGYWLPPLQIGGSLFPFLMNMAGWRMPGEFQMFGFAAFIGITLIGLWVFLQNSRIKDMDWKSTPTILAVFIVAPLLLAAISLLWRNIYVYRAIYPAALIAPILWSYAIWKVGKVSRQWALMLFIPALAVGVLSHYRPNGGRDDTAAFIQPVIDQWSAGDVILHTDATTAVSVGWYLPGKEYRISDHQAGNIVTVSEACRDAFHMERSNIQALKDAGYKRVWFVFNSSAYTSAADFDLEQQVIARWHGRTVAYKTDDSRKGWYDEVILIDLEGKE